MAKGDSRALGLSIVGLAVLFGIFVFYTTVISKFVPETKLSFLDFWRTDAYYCLLIPATIPTVIVFSYWGWASSQYFRYS
jgi:hypothetical protein